LQGWQSDVRFTHCEMNRLVYLVLYSSLMAALGGLLYFQINPLGSNSAYLFLLLALMVVVAGIRRRYLGMTFLSKYGFFSRERYDELFDMFFGKK